MKALRWILVGAMLALYALFAVNNWVPVPVSLPNGALAHPPLPVVVFVAFVLGWLPVLLLHIAARATWRRRIAKVERALDEATRPVATVPAVDVVGFPPAA